MKHAKPPLTTAEQYHIQYGIDLETIQNMIEKGDIR